MRPSAPQETLKEKTARGILWGGINNGGQQILNLLFGIFLARLLTPSDYGMVGLLTVFTLIAGALQESGFIAGLNRLESPRQEDYNAVFWFNVLCGAAIYALLFACAPLIARLFHQPLLTPLARLSFLSFVFSSWGTTPRAILFRQLKAKQNATITLVALTASGVVGVVLAWQGFAYWGIAIQNLVYCLCMTLLSWHYSGWRPSRHIDFRPLRGMIGFSSRLLLTNIFTTLNNNLFAMAFGVLYGERVVGIYNQANKWTMQGYTFINGTMWNVTQPVFARLTDDRERQCRVFRKLLRYTAFVSFPLILGLALIAPEFIVILITDKWIESAELMQILCVGGAFIPLTTFYANYLVSQGRSNIFLWNTVGLCLLQGAALLAAHPYGVRPMVVLYVALGILWFPAWHRYVRPLLGLRLRQALGDILPFLLAALVAMGLAALAAEVFTSLYLRLIVKIAVAAVVYIALMKYGHSVIYAECMTYLKERLDHRHRGEQRPL